MKKVMSVLSIAFCLTLGSFVNAQSVDFLVSATVPAATGVNIIATQVDANTGQFGQQVTAMNFDPMNLNSGLGIFLPNHFFAIDVGVTGGAGNPNLTFSYVEGSKPTGQIKGMGFKTSATFVKVTGSAGNQIEIPLPGHAPKILDGLNEQIGGAELAGGFSRTYIGIIDGSNQALINQGGEPFNLGDQAGSYNGTLTVTGTIQ